MSRRKNVPSCSGLLMLAGAAVALVFAAQRAAFAAPASHSPTVIEIADAYTAVGRPANGNDVFPIRNEASLRAYDQSVDRLLVRLQAIDRRNLSAEEQIHYSIVALSLESQRDLRVCRSELSDLNHITGWQILIPQQAASQSVATPAERERALRRWASLPAYIDADIGNLQQGLASGYSVPRTVVIRVIRQIDALLLTIPTRDGPFDQSAGKADDPQFQTQWRALVAEKITPAIQRFGEFLQLEYLPRARESIGLWDQPDGHRCYAAHLRHETTLEVTAESTYTLGADTVARSTAALKRIGAKLLGTSEVAQIRHQAQHAADNHFDSADALVGYANQVLARSIHKSAAYFLQLPRQPLIIEPLLSYQQGSGIGSHYEAADSISSPAVYRINLDDWQRQTRGAIAVTAVHEGIPGHHLQRELARSTPLPQSLAQLAYNSAYVEGWANYAEQLGAEMGVYDSPYAAIFRLSVRGQSLMIDPAIHEKRWTRAHVRSYLEALGETEHEADELIDRIAVQPAQLTAYDNGGLTILRLRERARKVLGTRFDIKEFHQRVLGDGVLPLMTLAQKIEDWIR